MEHKINQEKLKHALRRKYENLLGKLALSSSKIVLGSSKKVFYSFWKNYFNIKLLTKNKKIMGHSADATNRLLSNKALRTKGKTYETFKDYSKSRPSNKKYNFRTPTAKELKILEGKNRAFLKEQKMQNRVILIFGFAVGIALLYWFSQTSIWTGYVEGFGKFVR